MSWFSLNLGDAMLVDEALGRIQAMFQSDFAKAGNPSGMALFLRHESEGRLHCEVRLYLSPSSEVVARRVLAQPCGRPARDGLSLLVGPEDAWSTLFPEQERG